MKILDKYLLKSIFRTSLLVLFSLVLVFAFFQFIEELNEVHEKNYPLESAIKYILFLFPSYFNSLLVLALMIGTVFSIGQLNSDKELQIFHVASISQRNLIGKIIKYPFLISIVLILLFELIAPNALSFANQIKDQALGRNSIQNTSDYWSKKNNEILLLSKAKDNKYDLRLFNIKNNNLLSYIDSKGAYFSGMNLITGDSKKIQFQNNDNLIIPIESISQDNIDFKLDFEEVKSLSKNLKTISLFKLVKILSLSYQNQTNRNEIILELISRIIKPFTLIGMILITVSYILDFQRNISIGKRVFISIVIGTITHLFTKISSVISLKFDAMIAIGPILPTLILIMIGMLLVKIKIRP